MMTVSNESSSLYILGFPHSQTIVPAKLTLTLLGLRFNKHTVIVDPSIIGSVNDTVVSTAYETTTVSTLLGLKTVVAVLTIDVTSPAVFSIAETPRKLIAVSVSCVILASDINRS